MPINENKQLLRDYIAEVWDKDNVDALDDFLAPYYQRHRSPDTQPLSRAEQKALLIGFRTAFPDVTITVEDMIAEDDRIVFRSVMTGTHLGEFLGIAPTGRQVTFSLLDILRIENGKIVEQWGGPDVYDLVKQLKSE